MGFPCKIAVYLDDDSFSSCVHQATRIKSDLINNGLVPNEEKSIWCTTKQLTWLGLAWNLQFQTFSIPQKKIVKLLTSINDALGSPKFKAQQLASVTGLINSLFGSICKLSTHSHPKNMYNTYMSNGLRICIMHSSGTP